MDDVLSHKRFHDEEAAYQWVETHLWPEGPVCPKCGGKHDRVTKLRGKSTRIGTYKCKDCRKPFTVKVGTIFEDSHIPMRMWLQAIALMCASKKGISSNQLHRMTGLTLKSAWFMSHRIRDPRVFSLHKLWLSKQPSRDGLKKRRDEQQARAVAAVATQFMGLKFDKRELTGLPKKLAEGIGELTKAKIET